MEHGSQLLRLARVIALLAYRASVRRLRALGGLLWLSLACVGARAQLLCAPKGDLRHACDCQCQRHHQSCGRAPI